MHCSQIRSQHGHEKASNYVGVTTNRIRKTGDVAGALTGAKRPERPLPLIILSQSVNALYLLDRQCIMGLPPMNFEDTQLLTMPEAAASLRVHLRSLQRLVAAGEFPAPLKIGGRSLVPMSDVGAYIEKLIRRRNGGRVHP